MYIVCLHTDKVKDSHMFTWPDKGESTLKVRDILEPLTAEEAKRYTLTEY
jgi:hypothetical protein